MLTTVALFMATNIGILLMLSISMSVLGFEPYMQSQGVDLNLTSLLIMAAIFGMGGSLISLLMSKWSAKRGMHVHVIEQPADRTQQWLVETVSRQAAETLPGGQTPTSVHGETSTPRPSSTTPAQSSSRPLQSSAPPSGADPSGLVEHVA